MGFTLREQENPGRVLRERTGMRFTNWKDQAAAWRLDCGGWKRVRVVSLQAKRGK